MHAQTERMDAGKNGSSNVHSGVLYLIVFKFYRIHDFCFMLVIAVIFYDLCVFFSFFFFFT